MCTILGMVLAEQVGSQRKNMLFIITCLTQLRFAGRKNFVPAAVAVGMVDA